MPGFGKTYYAYAEKHHFQAYSCQHNNVIN